MNKSYGYQEAQKFTPLGVQKAGKKLGFATVKKSDVKVEEGEQQLVDLAPVTYTD